MLRTETFARLRSQEQQVNALQPKPAALAIRSQEPMHQISARFQNRDALLQHNGQLF